MSMEKLGKKYSLKSLLLEFDRIEIPIIQRDYAQGRTSNKETKIRKDILNYILQALTDEGVPVELDFVYGVEYDYTNRDGIVKKTLVPIDGQQRLTTLWLIHWFLAGKAGLLKTADSPARKMLERFTYETRVSSKDFMHRLCTEQIPFTDHIKSYIMDETPWFDEAWKLDPSIMGFLTMLDAITNHTAVKNNDASVLYKSLTADTPAVAFYFLSLEKFGLGEEIYTRMNARGKILTDFERFKSNFFKIIEESPRKDEISQKIEYEWVANLWPYRKKDIYIIDAPFMNWLRYVTMMLYVKSQAARSTKDNIDYLDIDVLNYVYSDAKNVNFLIHAFDTIPILSSENIECSLEWNGEKGLAPAINWIITTDNPGTDAVKQLTVFGALKFLQEMKSANGLTDYIRVVRNLIANTTDRGMREWPVMIESILKLISIDVYSTLLTPEIQLPGLRSEQREIEIFKAKLLKINPDARTLVARMDEDSKMQAREGNLIIEMSEPDATDKFTISLKDITPEEVDCEKLEKYFHAYVSLRNYNDKGDFNGIWGELLQTRLYKSNEYVCWWNDGDNNYIDYANHPVMMMLVRLVVNANGDVEKAISMRQHGIINDLMNKSNNDLSTLSDPKDQLYILYVLTTRILGKTWRDFFVCERFNFGWVEAETGYTSPFKELLGGPTNKIFQTYPQRFRSETGVVPYRTPYIMNAKVRGHNIFDKLVEWVNL